MSRELVVSIDPGTRNLGVVAMLLGEQRALMGSWMFGCAYDDSLTVSIAKAANTVFEDIDRRLRSRGVHVHKATIVTERQFRRMARAQGVIEGAFYMAGNELMALHPARSFGLRLIAANTLNAYARRLNRATPNVHDLTNSKELSTFLCDHWQWPRKRYLWTQHQIDAAAQIVYYCESEDKAKLRRARKLKRSDTSKF